MNKTDSYLTAECLCDEARLLSQLCHTSMEETDHWRWYRNIPGCWYHRIHIFSANPNDPDFWRHLEQIYHAPEGDLILSFITEDLYPEWEEDLTQRGFSLLKPQKGMVYDLPQWQPTPQPSQIRRIFEEDIDDWSTAVSRGVGNLPAPEAYRQLIQDESNLFYAYEDRGMMVGTVQLYLDGNNAGIFNVSTLPEYRHKGIATALMRTVLNDAKAAGCSKASLQASVYGEPVYQKMGFRVVNHFLNYTKKQQ